MANTSSSELPKVREMVVVHNGFRHFFGEMHDLVRACRVEDARAAAVMADHVDLGIHVLHDHHQREDASLWPLLLERAKPEGALIALMQDQHAELSRCLDVMEQASTAFRGAPTAENRETLAIAIGAMLEVIELHMAQEESQILPICERVVTATEWDTMAGDEPPSMKEMAALLPAIEANNTPDDVALLLASLPGPVRAIVIPLIVRPMAGRYRRKLHAATAAS